MSVSSSSGRPATMTEIFVGCGSNIEPLPNLRRAIAELEKSFGSVRQSGVYQSPAFGFDGPDFLNMVVAFSSNAGADAVESVLSEIESESGRNQRDRSGSRTLDLDLLLVGQRVDAGRRLPRTDVLLYPFVLAPLAELAPALIHPVTGENIGDAWQRAAAGAGSLRRLGALEAI